jgi:hypothetical protein
MFKIKKLTIFLIYIRLKDGTERHFFRENLSDQKKEIISYRKEITETVDFCEYKFQLGVALTFLM